MENEIQDEIFSFKQDLLGSRNYYSDLWGRYRLLRALFFLLEGLSSVILVSKGIDLNGLWARGILFLGVLLATFKYINMLPQRIKDLSWQYHECQSILNDLEKEQNVSFELIGGLRERFAKVEKRDLPTIECLMAVCRNKALVALGDNRRFKMSWFERHVGIFCPWVKYDDHAKLVDQNRD